MNTCIKSLVSRQQFPKLGYINGVLELGKHNLLPNTFKIIKCYMTCGKVMMMVSLLLPIGQVW